MSSSILGQNTLSAELHAAYERETSLAKQLGRVKAENAELQTKLLKVTASLKTAKVTAREALIEMADQNAKLVQAYVDKKRECKQLKVCVVSAMCVCVSAVGSCWHSSKRSWMQTPQVH